MRIARSLAAIAAVLLLAGCIPWPPKPAPDVSAPTPTPATSLTPTATPKPTPTATPVAAEPAPPGYADDVLLVVTATATADNGAVLDLTLQVHRAQSWDTPGAGQAATMTAACAGGLDEGVFAANLWSFATVTVDAVQREGGSWPGNRRIFMLPYASYLDLATDGFPADDDEASADTPHCRRDKVIDGQGAGSVVVGFAGDSDAAGAAGNFTRWANHNYGFVGVRVAGQTAASAGITISDCAAIVTAAGLELNGNADWWSSRVDESHCVHGSLQEQQDY